MNKKITIKEFIKRARLTHGQDNYDYTDTVLTGMRNKVTVKCPTHGYFDINASNHVNGNGCKQCGIERQRHSPEAFIEKANKKHKNKYTYDNIQYKNVTTKLDIICKKHGVFSQTPKDHLHGYGCPDCGGTKKVTTKQFITRANKKHKHEYDYTKTKITGMNNNTIITCKIHGDFNQRPADHINGVGCPECAYENGGVYKETFFENYPEKKNIPAKFYFVNGDIDGIVFCKVGITVENIKNRFRGKYTVHRNCVIELPLYEAFKLEQYILSTFRDARFRYRNVRETLSTGWTECFSLKLKNNIQQEIKKYIYNSGVIQEVNNGIN